MNVSQIMSRNVFTCRPEDSMAMAAGLMWDHDIGCVPVVGTDGLIAGVITDRDICMAAYTQGRPLSAMQVDSAMSRQVHSCLPTDGLVQAEEVMRSHKVRRMPVIDAEGKIVGIIAINDLAREAARQQGKRGRELSGEEVATTLAAVCQPRSNGVLVTAA